MNNYILVVFIILMGTGCSINYSSEAINQANESLFLLDAKADTSLECKFGTKIFIPMGAFATIDSNLVTANITLSIKEFYKKPDMVMEGLTTISNGKILVSGGMVKIEAIKNTETLILVKPISIQFNQESWGNRQYYPYIRTDSIYNINWIESNTVYLDGPFVDSVWEVNGIEYVRRKIILESSVFSGTALNWINADIFLDEILDMDQRNRKKKIIVKVHNRVPNTAYLVLKDFKSVLPGKCLGSGIFSFEAIPDTLQVYAVVFDRTNDAYGLALSKVDMKSDTCHLNLKNTPLTEIRQALKIFEN